MFLGLFKRKSGAITVTPKRNRKAKKAKTSSTPNKKKTTKAKTTKRPAVKTLKKKPLSKTRLKKGKPAKGVLKSKLAKSQIVGKVTHYFPHVKAAVILVTKGRISIGDKLRIKGHTTDFKQKVNSLQINNVPIKQAEKGQEIGLLVKTRTRGNDIVYKL